MLPHQLIFALHVSSVVLLEVAYLLFYPSILPNWHRISEYEASCFYGNFNIYPNSVRGILGTVLVLTFNFGILCAFVLGNFFTYDKVAWILSSLSVVFLLCFPFLKETPQHLLNKNKIKVSYPCSVLRKILMYFKMVEEV